MKYTVEIQGLEEADRALKRLADNVEAAADPATTAGAELIAAEWRRRVPVDEGTYREGITVQHQRTDDGATALINVRNEAARYAHRSEFGFMETDSLGRSYHQPPAPAARPAFDTGRTKAEAAAAAKLKAAAERTR
jgi:HK97 gp10 family phage protein